MTVPEPSVSLQDSLPSEVVDFDDFTMANESTDVDIEEHNKRTQDLNAFKRIHFSGGLNSASGVRTLVCLEIEIGSKKYGRIIIQLVRVYFVHADFK
jgi:hypothetical protein